MAMLSLVLWQSVRRPENLLMAGYMTLVAIWSGLIIAQQFALVVQVNPIPMLRLSVLVIAYIAPILFYISVYYCQEAWRRQARWVALAGIGMVTWVGIPLMQGQVLVDVFFNTAGVPTYRVDGLGWLSFMMMMGYHVATLVLLWRSKHELARFFFAAVLIVALTTSTAVLNNWLPGIRFPIFGATISVIIFANIIIRQSYFSPLVQLNHELGQANEQLMVLSRTMQEKEANLRALLTNTSDLVWSIDLDYRVVTINLTAADFFALIYDHQFKEGDCLLDYLPPDEKEAWRDWYGRAFNGERVTVETQYTMPNVNSMVDLEIALNPILDDQNNITGISVFARDITSRKEAERQLRLQALALENMNESVIITNLRGFITYCNPATATIFGYSVDELMGQMPEIWHAPEDALNVSESIQSGLSRDGRWDGQIRFVRKDGKRGICDAIVLPLYNDQGQRVAALGVSHDVTEQKQYEAELREAKDAAEAANRAKSSFLASMSHELRTPLNAIIGYSEMLEDVVLDKEYADIASDLHRITTAGRHLLTLINDVLDLSKIEAGKTNLYLENFLISDLVNEVIIASQNLIEQNGNQLEVSLAPDLGRMYGDATKVRQILVNLISNAAKFTRRGRIIIRGERETASPHDLIILTVRDTGIGMTDAEMSRIFSAFTQADDSTTRQYGGTGLGLTISHRFAELMGGTITVESQPRMGSTFVVTLPAVITPQEDARPPRPAISNGEEDTAVDTATTIIRPALQRGIVLVISPREDHRDQMVRWLLQKQYRTYAAPDGYRGQKLAQRLRPHAIVLATNLPDYDYREFIADIRADNHLRTIPFLLYDVSQAQLEDDFPDDAAIHLVSRTENGLVTKLQQIAQPVPPTSERRSSPSRILVVEDNYTLRDILRLTLEKRGFEVVEAIDSLMAIEFLQTTNRRPDIILLDLMMPRLDGFGFVDQIRAMPGVSAIPIIVVTAKPLTTAEHERLRDKVDDILYKGIYSQNDLLRRIDQLIAIHAAPLSSTTPRI
ncbi:MAG: PAS domain S-box protein [Anaerolineales bacterium]|nr:PAS domain S-box protein [Anaerolineales bacterium]